MAREDPQLKLRLTDEMKDRVTEAARVSGRSVNAEIVSRLEDSFENADLAARVERLELEKKHLVTFARLSEESRKIGESMNYSSQVLLYLLADMIRIYAEGDTSAIDQFIAKDEGRKLISGFKMPVKEEEEDSL